jgi:hypothetical protein
MSGAMAGVLSHTVLAVGWNGALVGGVAHAGVVCGWCGELRGRVGGVAGLGELG